MKKKIIKKGKLKDSERRCLKCERVIKKPFFLCSYCVKSNSEIFMDKVELPENGYVSLGNCQ